MQKINDLPKNRLVKLVSRLKKISLENEAYILAFLQPKALQENIERYKKMIYNSLMFDPIDLEDDYDMEKAEQHARNYFAASKDKLGEAELWLYLVEKGNEITLDYGDIDEGYYDTMCEWFETAVRKIVSLKETGEKVDEFIERARIIYKSTENIGWGYHDFIADVFSEHFGK